MNKVTIIAEIGSNHNGCLSTAFRLIDEATDGGADIVKFQSFLVDDLLSRDDPNAERLRALQLKREWYPELMAHCAKRGVRFLSTATNETTIGWMEEAGAWGYKVASCNITHRPLLERLIGIGKPLIISTGMASLAELEELKAFFAAKGFGDYSILHCISQYPTPPGAMRLLNILKLKEMFSCPVGLSDHSLGTHLAVAAVALGATIVEKHISLDRTGLGMDHEVAVLPDEFRAMCAMIRDTEATLTVGFDPDPAGVFAMRRSLHFARDMEAGEPVRREDIKVVRPEDGLPPSRLESVLDKRTCRAVSKGEAVREEDIR